MKLKYLTILFPVLFMISANSNSVEQDVTRVDVLAIEYHPFTTIKERSGGIAFSLLKEKTKDLNIKWRPEIVPPKRAYQMITEQDWCASFYPIPESQYSKTIRLSDYSVKIGLVRKKSNNTFRWQSLDEFSQQTIALLRTGENSAFAQQFTDAGLQIVFVDSILAAVQMVALGRVDLAMFDNYSFNQLEINTKESLEFSDKALIDTHIQLFINPDCNLPEIKKPIE